MKNLLESIQILAKYTSHSPTIDIARGRLVLKGLPKTQVSEADRDRLSYLDVFYDEDEGYFYWAYLE